MMTVYLVILEDRHKDIEVEVFALEADARGRFDEIVEEWDFGDDKPDDVPAGWLANVRLSNEGDYVSVRKTEMQGRSASSVSAKLGPDRAV